MSCKKAQEFLAAKGIEVTIRVDAKKERLGPGEALCLVRGAETLKVARGKKVVIFNLKKDRPSDKDLLPLILGPSGNLRAPTLRSGKTLLVGFHPDLYKDN